MSAKGNPCAVQKPIVQQKSELNEGDSQNRPGFQTGSSLLQFLHERLFAGAGRSGRPLHETMFLMGSHTDNALGLYLSIPFCRSKCTYCNFASGVYPASEHARYVARLIKDLRAAGVWAA